jgi:hypothetical protein
VVILALAIASVFAWWTAERRIAARQLAAEVQKVRARGEPLTTVELDAYYVAAPGRPDMTDEILTALAICDAPEFKSLAKDLPIVGTQGPAIPDPPQAWEQLEAVEAYLAHMESALETFREVERRDGTARYPADLRVGIAAKLDHLNQLRHGARILSLDFHVALRRGRSPDAVDDILATLALARTLDREPFLVSQMLSLAITGMGVNNAILLLKAGGVGQEELEKLQRGLRKTEFAQGLHQGFVGELALGYTASIDPLVVSSKDKDPTPEQMQQLATRVPQRAHDAAMIVQIDNRMIVASDQGLSESLRVGHEIEAETKAIMKDRIKSLLYIVTLLYVPACEAAVEASARSAAMRDSADAAIAAELYRRKYGKWPTSLDELVPEFLPAVPIDPFSEEPLILVSTAEELKIYSIGKDRVDDGGVFKDSSGPDFGLAVPLRSDNGP